MSVGRGTFERVGVSSVHIGHLFELFRHKGRAVRHQDPTGNQFAKEQDAVCINEGDVGKIEHEPVFVVAVLPEDVVARSAQFLDPWPSHLAFEP
jgi:hypothetical protein